VCAESDSDDDDESGEDTGLLLGQSLDQSPVVEKMSCDKLCRFLCTQKRAQVTVRAVHQLKQLKPNHETKALGFYEVEERKIEVYIPSSKCSEKAQQCRYLLTASDQVYVHNCVGRLNVGAQCTYIQPQYPHYSRIVKCDTELQLFWQGVPEERPWTSSNVTI
jgi:hypothetical protein